MKTFTCTALLSLTLAFAAQAAAPQQQQIDTRITPLGDADITITIKFDAEGWQNWKSTVGENPSVLKRELDRMFSSMVLSDYKLDRNDLEREVSFHVHAVGVCRYLGNNIWETDLDTGVASGMVTRRKLNENTFLVSQSLSEGGITMQQEMTLTTPTGASALTEAKSEMGMPVLRYEFQPPNQSSGVSVIQAGMSSLVLIAGVLLLILGFASRKGEDSPAAPNVTSIEEPKLETVSA